MKFVAYLRMMRVANLFLLGIGVALGFWLSHNMLGVADLIFLIIAAASCAGFGNVVNDIADIKTDIISHPDRPLARKDLSIKQASIFAAGLALAAIATSFFVSPVYFLGVLFPLLLLALYAKFFKATPLAGNVLVSILVAYGIVFGGLTAPLIYRLFIPAALAFLLNMCREIVKDVQDLPGDSAAGITTSASLPDATLKKIITCCAALYVLLVFMPFILHQFDIPYVIVCLIAVIPLHAYWFAIFHKSEWKKNVAAISLLIKYEMFFGLGALAIDRLIVLPM